MAKKKDGLDALRKKKYRDYAWYLYLIASDDTGSLKDWGKRLARQLQKDDSEGFENTKAWIDQTWGRTAFAQKYAADEEAGRIEAAQGKSPEFKADYLAALQNTANYVRDQAAAYGIQLEETEIDDIARKARLAKMSEGEINRLLRPYIEETLAVGDDLTGTAGDFQTSLKQWAARNGIDLDQGTVNKYIYRMTLGEQSIEDVKQDIRMTYLRGAYPAWSDRIEAGFDPEDIVKPYRSAAAKLLEVDPNELSFDDPLIKMSMQGVDNNGKPAVVPLYEFERKVRQDPRWQYTDNAYSTYTKVGTDLLQMFGFR